MYLTLIQKGVSISLSSLSSRVNFVSVSAVAYIFFTYYCGDLTAKMTYKGTPNRMKSLEVNPTSLIDNSSISASLSQDFLDSGYTMRVLKGSAVEGWFREAARGSPMNKIYNEHIKDKPHLLYEDQEDFKTQLKVCVQFAKEKLLQN